MVLFIIARKAYHFLLKQRWNLCLLSFLVIFFIPTINPVQHVFDYNPDEGYALMQTSLLLKGFSLYKEIWLDQTPLLPIILSFWFKLFGVSVAHGRFLILIFSVILLLALYQTIKNQYGHLAAFMGVVFLALSNVYARNSVSVMIGIPSLALAMLSIYCIVLYRKLSLKYLLVFSGIFIALSLQTKLFTLFFMPFIALETIQSKKLNLRTEKKQSYSLVDCLLWFSSFLIIFLIITLIFFHLDLSLFFKQLLQPHLIGVITLVNDNFKIIWRLLLTDYDILLLALTGIILIIRQKKMETLMPVLWFVSAIVILFIHRPIWTHYYPLISIPMCWLAAISFGEFFHMDIRQGWFPKKNKYAIADAFLRWVTASLIILTVTLLPIKYYRMYIAFEGEGKTNPQEQTVINLLKKYKSPASWIITDRPTFAFYADMLVPPEMTTICSKRSFLDKSDQDYFIDILEKYKIKLILIDLQQLYGSGIMSYIKENFNNVYRGYIPNRGKSWMRWNLSFTNINYLMRDLWAALHKDNLIPEEQSTENIWLYVHKNLSEYDSASYSSSLKK